MRKIRDFIVGEQCAASLHLDQQCQVSGWKFSFAFVSDIYLFTQFRVCVMWQVVLGVAGLIRETALSVF